MKKIKLVPVITFFLVLAGAITGNVRAQSGTPQPVQTILKKDSLFWLSYNNCDTTGYNNLFSDDLEFYHDKGGITLGVQGLALSLAKNLCSNKDFRVFREEVKGSVKLFPLEKNGEVYGAILSGEHIFYIKEKDKPQRVDGRAKFTHLWLLKDGVWKMTRILSFDHQPA